MLNNHGQIPICSHFLIYLQLSPHCDPKIILQPCRTWCVKIGTEYIHAIWNHPSKGRQKRIPFILKSFSEHDNVSNTCLWPLYCLYAHVYVVIRWYYGKYSAFIHGINFVASRSISISVFEYRGTFLCEKLPQTFPFVYFWISSLPLVAAKCFLFHSFSSS